MGLYLISTVLPFAINGMTGMSGVNALSGLYLISTEAGIVFNV